MRNIGGWRNLGSLISRRGFCLSTRENDKCLNSVVKLHCTKLIPESNKGGIHVKERIVESISSCFIIGAKKLLTAFQCIEHHQAVSVQRRGCWKKFPARVVVQAMDCQLALLSVESDEFWDGASAPLKLGKMPSLTDAVTVIGYPRGGVGISVTRGIVSRIEVQSYGFTSCDLMMIQVDAAINHGSFGGPAMNDEGEVLGVVFKMAGHMKRIGSMKKTIYYQNMSCLIPTSVVSHFLADYERNGNYIGFPYLSALLQELDKVSFENLCSSAYLNKGVVVLAVDSCSVLGQTLQWKDIILSIDGVEISDVYIAGERSVQLVNNVSHLISQRFMGDVIQMGILRKRRLMNVSITLEGGENPFSLMQKLTRFVTLAKLFGKI